jgi:pimeloyl-ACP methyl ester carboxylesterase
MGRETPDRAAARLRWLDLAGILTKLFAVELGKSPPDRTGKTKRPDFRLRISFGLRISDFGTRSKVLHSVIAIATLLWLSGCASSPDATSPASATPKSHFARFGTNKVHYVVAGKGKHTLVFVHGWSCNAGFWREQVPAFVDHARVILVDLPGHGESDKPEADYTVDYFASAVLAVMRDAHVDKATLIGHSMGTPVICRVYAQAPEKVAAIVSVDGLLRRPKISAEQRQQFVAPFRTPGYRDATIQFIGAMFPNPGTEGLRERVLSEMLQTPQHVMRSSMEHMFSADEPAWDLPPGVKIPVLVLNARSPMWTPEYADYARSLSPKTDYRVIEGAGHFIAQEKPAEFNAALTEMLRNFDLIAK